MQVQEMVKAAVTGPRAKAVHKVSEPLSLRVPLSRDQIEAIFGALFLVLATLQYARLLRSVWRARNAPSRPRFSLR